MRHLIVFSHLRWSLAYQRPQHLLSRLSHHYKVLFVEEPVHAEGPAWLACEAVEERVNVLRPITPLEETGFHDEQLALLEPLLAAHLRDHGIDDYLVWFYTPMAMPLLRHLQPAAVVYDCVGDTSSAARPGASSLRQRETLLLKSADLVFTSGPALQASKREVHLDVHCLPSAVDAASYAPSTLALDGDGSDDIERLQAHIPSPRLGFCGVVDQRIDLDLLAALADADPLWQVVMAGPVVGIDPGELPRRPNIHWLGVQAHSLVPHLLSSWDVGLMPFVLDEASRFIAPSKALEYMAAGKPVVSTALPEVAALYGSVTRVSNTAAGFVEHCREALGENARLREQRLAEMDKCVRGFSWDEAAASVHTLIERTLGSDRQAGARQSIRVNGDMAAKAAAKTAVASPLARSVAVRWNGTAADPQSAETPGAARKAA